VTVRELAPRFEPMMVCEPRFQTPATFTRAGSPTVESQSVSAIVSVEVGNGGAGGSGCSRTTGRPVSRHMPFMRLAVQQCVPAALFVAVFVGLLHREAPQRPPQHAPKALQSLSRSKPSCWPTAQLQ
jgi:hypothetical protein